MAWEGDDPVPVHEEGVHWPPVQDVQILVQAGHSPLLLFPQSLGVIPD